MLIKDTWMARAQRERYERLKHHVVVGKGLDKTWGVHVWSTPHRCLDARNGKHPRNVAPCSKASQPTPRRWTPNARPLLWCQGAPGTPHLHGAAQANESLAQCCTGDGPYGPVLYPSAFQRFLADAGTSVEEAVFRPPKSVLKAPFSSVIVTTWRYLELSCSGHIHWKISSCAPCHVQTGTCW